MDRHSHHPQRPRATTPPPIEIADRQLRDGLLWCRARTRRPGLLGVAWHQMAKKLRPTRPAGRFTNKVAQLLAHDAPWAEVEARLVADVRAVVRILAGVPFGERSLEGAFA